MKKLFFLGFLVGMLSVQLFSQNDSLIRELDQLDLGDLILEDSFSTRTQVAAASRSLQNISELPFPIFVIRRSEIVSNGYITLVDALKSMPGIRVSQPGSALEGETFTMRGLLGNTYAKVLINGNPIKPYIVSGMPIGAQLPIQQAERIEVIYGPAAALYGADASSGIINIVLGESERPVFTKASLHVGSDSYRSMNLLFGGKIGKGDNVARFKLYGIDTRFEKRRVFYDRETLYNPVNYLGGLVDIRDIVEDNNYRGSAMNPNIQDTPHESRSLGGEVHYRFLSFGLLNMNRSDHSSIGFNPAAVSYANPLTNTGENIVSGFLKSQFNILNVQLETKLEYLGYAMNTGSNSLYVHPLLNGLLNASISDSTTFDETKALIDANFFSGPRFAGASSREYSLEQTINFSLFQRGSVQMGLKYTRGNGQTIREFQSNVGDIQRSNFENLNPTFTDENIEEGSLFIQVFQPVGKYFNLLLGAQFLNRSNGDFAEAIRTFNPRLAVLYRVSEAIQFRSSYSTAVRAPSPYFNATTYTYEPDNYEFLTLGRNLLKAESTQSYELGMRWEISKDIDFDLSISYTDTDGFINYNIAFENPRPNQILDGFTLGYFNDENSRAELFDVQSYLRFKNIIPSIKLGGSFSLNASRGRETLTTTDITNFNNTVQALEGLRAHPNFLSRLSLTAVPFDGFLIRIDQNLASRTLTRNSFRLNTISTPSNQSLDPYNASYYTMDISFNYTISQNFLFYSKLINVLNAQYAGIDASSSNDVLFYNPQSQFIFRLGLNYELN